LSTDYTDLHGFYLKIIFILVLIRENQFNLRHPCPINIAAPPASGGGRSSREIKEFKDSPSSNQKEGSLIGFVSYQ
jgi:hypothetical protein